MNASLVKEIKACLSLAIPLAAAQLAEGSINLIDTLMMGWLGGKTLAAGGLGATTFMFFLIIGTGLLSSAGALAAIALGQGKPSQLHQITSGGFWLLIACCLPTMLLLGNFAPLLQVLGQDKSNALLAQSYLQAILWGFPAAMGFVLLKNLASAVGQPRIIMLTMVGGIGLNAIANYGLMFGKWGLPRWELVGLGWASTFAFWVKFLVILTYFYFNKKLVSCQFFKDFLYCSKKTIQELLKIGIPTAILLVIEAGLFICTTYWNGTFGTVPLAAHQIALQTAATTFMIPYGISYAVTMRVGINFGQKNLQDAGKAGFVGIGLGAVFMFIMGLIFLGFPKLIVGLYLDLTLPKNQEIINLAIILIRIAGVFQIFDGVQVIANGALRGIQDTRIPLVIGIFSYWFIGLGTGYLLNLFWNLQAIGLWWGSVFGLMMAAIILTSRFYQQTLMGDGGK